MLELRRVKAFVLLMIPLLLLSGCSTGGSSGGKSVPQADRYGIYVLDLSTEDVDLIYSSSEAIGYLAYNSTANNFAFSQRINNGSREAEEIFVLNIDGTGKTRLTNNNYWDLYPVFSPDGTQIAFLTLRSTNLDLYKMDADGGNQELVYDSGVGRNDADPNWGSGGRIAFTRDSQIWTVGSDGSGAQQLTDPPDAGVWGNANLPFGDYDPRFSPDGTKIVFERMDDDTSSHGNYNLYIINSTGTGETKITATDYSQGLANWSHAGDKLVYIVAAIGSEGKYDIWMVNADGTGNQNITPSYFPDNFLCHSAAFSADDTKIYFTGEWYQ